MTKKSFKLRNVVAIAICLAGFTMFSGCERESNNDTKPPEDQDGNFEELNQVLDEMPTIDVDIYDLKFDDGENIFEFLMENPEFYERISPHLQDNRANSKMSLRASSEGSYWGLLSAKREMTGWLSIMPWIFLKDSEGVAYSSDVRKRIDDKKNPTQKGLYYSFGQKNWTVRQKQPHNQSCTTEVFGLDCSGLVYNVIRECSPLLDVSVWLNTEHNAHGYWTTPSKWNKAIKNNYNGKLQFKRYKTADLEKLPQKGLLPGDIIFYFKNGIAKHIGIVAADGTGQLRVAQSNGSDTECTVTAEMAKKQQFKPYLGQFANGIPSRGPRFIDALAPIKQWGGYDADFGVIRLVANIDSKWRLAVRCEGMTTDITTFDIEIKTDANGVIQPIQTTGQDYTGEVCDVYFTGQYDEQNNILNGQIRKTYSDNTRTDGFSIRLVSDYIDNIVMDKIVINGGCTNVLRILNLESTTLKSSKIPTPTQTETNINTVFDSKR